MKHNYPYLRNTAFLNKVDQLQAKEQYVRITVLSFDEDPIQSIEGVVTDGTLSLNGKSSMRRTGNITMVAQEGENDLTNVNNLISINKKVDIEVGYLNTTDEYQEFRIIWFPQGTYIITAPTIASSANGITISLQLQDKMCLLDGTCGGVIPASTTFHQYETIDENGKMIILKPTIYQIIQELVNHFGGEQLGRIIISDVDTRVRQVMKWTGSTPLYITDAAAEGGITHVPTTDASELQDAAAYHTYPYGSDVGYIYTDFTYPGELVANSGDTVCTILDKIKSALGNYEYFYDVEGNFHFQEIKNYLNTSQSTSLLREGDFSADFSKGKAVYVFDDARLISSFNNAPRYDMIKNDFVIWGMREDTTGRTWPIRYHLVIDKKPRVGNTYNVFSFEDSDGITKYKAPLIFANKKAFPAYGVEEIFYMSKETGEIFKWDALAKQYNLVQVNLRDIKTNDWRTELYLQGSVAEPLGEDSNYYYPELKNEWTKIYDVENGDFKQSVIEDPSSLDFYLDFIDVGTEVSNLAVSNIGRRTKVLTNDKINCIFEPEIPNLVLLSPDDPNLEQSRRECRAKGQDYIQLSSGQYSLLAAGGSSNSAYNAARELLYQYTSYNERITLNAIPIFYLEPGTRITVRDNRSGIYGDYMIDSINLPLDINGTMNVTCTRALERI